MVDDQPDCQRKPNDLFDSAGQDFYPGVIWNVISNPLTATGTQDYSSSSGTYIAADRAIVASFQVGASEFGPYGHDVSVWGWDEIHLIYITDNDDGVDGLRTYSFTHDAAGNITILGYTNDYTRRENVEHHRLVRLNLNDPFVEPAGSRRRHRGA